MRPSVGGAPHRARPSPSPRNTFAAGSLAQVSGLEGSERQWPLPCAHFFFYVISSSARLLVNVTKSFLSREMNVQFSDIMK